MKTHCPKCGSPKIRKPNLGQLTGGTIGFIVGLINPAHYPIKTTPPYLYIMQQCIPPRGPKWFLLGRFVNGCLGANAGSIIGQSLDNQRTPILICRNCGYSFPPLLDNPQGE